MIHYSWNENMLNSGNQIIYKLRPGESSLSSDALQWEGGVRSVLQDGEWAPSAIYCSINILIASHSWHLGK